MTEVAPLKAFYPAEAYHQNYATSHPNNPYIVINDAPKVEHLRQIFPELYRWLPRQALAGVACRRRQKKYESAQSTAVAAAQPHASGPSPTEKWAMSAEARSMAKPA